MWLRTIFVLLMVAGAWAQQGHPVQPPQKKDDSLTPSSFSAKGLHHEEDLNDLFSGNFADFSLDRGSTGFSVLFQKYLEAYARHCDAYLPANKVQMTQQVCADAPSLPGQSDVHYGPPGCSSWRTVSLGYADPALYAAKTQLNDEQRGSMMKDLLSSKNLIGAARDVLQITDDMDALVRMNACDGAGLRRFQENLVLYSKGKQGILLPGMSPSPAEVDPIQRAVHGGGSAPPAAGGRRSVPTAAAPIPPPAAAGTTPEEQAANREKRAQKAMECRQLAMKDHPQDRAAMAQEYTSCLQGK